MSRLAALLVLFVRYLLIWLTVYLTAFLLVTVTLLLKVLYRKPSIEPSCCSSFVFSWREQIVTKHCTMSLPAYIKKSENRKERKLITSCPVSCCNHAPTPPPPPSPRHVPRLSFFVTSNQSHSSVSSSVFP
jgi:hypothetical protein